MCDSNPCANDCSRGDLTPHRRHAVMPSRSPRCHTNPMTYQQSVRRLCIRTLAFSRCFWARCCSFDLKGVGCRADTRKDLESRNPAPMKVAAGFLFMEYRQMSAPDADRVRIFDTTLRDGEQSPGCSMTLDEKLRIARALADLGVDIIEAGFPAASQGDWEAVAAVARRGQGPDDLRARALQSRRHRQVLVGDRQGGAAERLHVFLATSAIHREHKLKMARDQIIRTRSRGRPLCTNPLRRRRVLTGGRVAHRARIPGGSRAGGRGCGRDHVNIPDTVGYTTPQEFHDTFTYLRDRVRGIDGVTLSVHCHDDLGMAVANSLSAVRAGARQVECTINGIGERAGNCSMEEVVMALAVRQQIFGVRTRHPDAATVSDLPACFRDHRHADPAQQGDHRRERLRARIRHPPARHAAPRLDLRNHAAAGCRPLAQQSGARQAQRTPCIPGARAGTGLRARRGGIRDGLYALQGAGRSQEGAFRRRHRSARAPDRRRQRRALVARVAPTEAATGQDARRHGGRLGHSDGRRIGRRQRATARSMPRSPRSNARSACR